MGRGVAQPRELADVVGDRGADRLRRLPGGTALVDVVALAQDPPDLVVVDAAPVDLAAVLREAHLDRRLELDDPRAQLGRRLLRQEDVVEEVEPAAGRPVGALARRLDRREPLAVGEEVRERRLELDAPLLVLLVRDDVEVPPGVGDLGVSGASSLSIWSATAVAFVTAAAVYGIERPLRSPAARAAQAGKSPE